MYSLGGLSLPLFYGSLSYTDSEVLSICIYLPQAAVGFLKKSCSVPGRAKSTIFIIHIAVYPLSELTSLCFLSLPLLKYLLKLMILICLYVMKCVPPDKGPYSENVLREILKIFKISLMPRTFIECG